MTVRASDSFARGDGALGTAPTGQAWSVRAGSVSIASQRAHTTNARAIATVNVGSADCTVDADCGAGAAQGGYAIYFRVSDASNWWRVVVNANSNSYIAGYQTLYHTDGTCDYNSSPYGLKHSWSNSSYSSYPGVPAGHPESDSHISSSSDYTTSEPYYGTSYTWSLRLEKCVAGTVTTVANIPLSYPPTHLRAVASGSSISAWCATTGNATVTQQASTTDSFNAGATAHGLGYGDSTGYGNSDGLDNFSIDVPNRAPTDPGAPSVSPSPVNKVGTITWTASTDPDGDAIHYYVDLSTDGGSTWTRILNNVQPGVTYDFSGVASTVTAKLRVLAADVYETYNAGSWIVGPTFQIQHAPYVPAVLL